MKFTTLAITSVAALSIAACGETDTATAGDDVDTTATDDGGDTTVIVDEVPVDEDGATISVDDSGVSVEGKVDVTEDVAVEVDTDGN